MFRTVLLAALLALALIACKKEQPAADAASAPAAKAAAASNDPAESINQVARSIRQGDLSALLAASLPPAELDRLRQDWDEERVKPLSDEDRQEFVDGWGKLVAPDFVDRTMAEITPQLNELKGQLGPMIGFGAMMAVGSIEQSQELTATQKAQATKLLNAAAAWAMSQDFSDPAKLRKALTHLATAARATGIVTPDDVRKLTFDQLLAKGSVLFVGIKEALNVYGISIDDTLGSMQSTVLSQDGDSAKVSTSMKLFGETLTFENELVRKDGRWYGKDALETLAKREAEAGGGTAISAP